MGVDVKCYFEEPLFDLFLFNCVGYTNLQKNTKSKNLFIYN